VLGNPDGDITVIEFFDYNCGYCKRAAPIISKLLETDKNVRLVYREWPILSEGSEFAARASLAAQKQGRYKEFHFKLMNLSSATEDSVLNAAKEFGYNTEQLLVDMEDPEIDQHIETSNNLSEALGFTGTPSFVIGTQAIPGLASYEGLTQIIAEERKKLQ
jgi:protein-disulfide isomerase